MESVRRRGDRAIAFTLVELLVVIGILGVLAALVFGGVAEGRFRSRVTSCANNYRQWGIAATLYAGEDSRGRLPAFPLPLAKFAGNGYGELDPWFVSLAMATNMARFGVSVPMWFCPARPFFLQNANALFAREHAGRSLVTVDDLTEYWRSTSHFFGAIEHCWWVPRPLEGSKEVYPDPKLVKSRIQDGWPIRLEDPAGPVQPILTDSCFGLWNEQRTQVDINGRGHSFPASSLGSQGTFVRNINLLFVDGHVETRGRKSIQWQIEGARGFLVAY
jgi:prepilin-type N-terminal cleavage/methylation domain-containing protein/prepilin-type processing-associated H-X9-DG protein